MNLDLTSPGLKAALEAGRRFSLTPGEDRGAVYTRPEIVELILDLVGYTEEQMLPSLRLLEPAAGRGEFLVVAAQRLVRSYVARGGALTGIATSLASRIVAYEIHPDSLVAAKSAVTNSLTSLGVSPRAARSLCEAWIQGGDFLLADVVAPFSHVVGNPPYVRQEMIPAELLDAYRARYSTMFDRADLYIPFFERSLDLLGPGGRLGFICTDRWTKNKYGGPLRRKVSEGFSLTHFVDLTETAAFHTDVMTYPAVTVIQRSAPSEGARSTRTAYRPAIEATGLKRLAKAMVSDAAMADYGVTDMRAVANGSEPWLLHAPERLALVRRLEATFPVLENAGCKIGIGVATGNDAVYIRPMSELDVESSRKLPIVRTQDLRGGCVVWGGMGVLNPFEDDGRVVNLDDYPRFAAYLAKHAGAIKNRNVARRNPDRWFRTIDRITPSLARTPKLLVPDIKGDAHVVYEDGQLYPHHNLYYVLARTWDLRALQAVLQSGIARLFVATYSTAMRGGFLRFQAQYLRRIRLPLWDSVPARLQVALRSAALEDDHDSANEATYELYGLNRAERILVRSQMQGQP